MPGRLLLGPHISASLTSAEKSAPTLFIFSVCFPAGPGLVNLLPWFQLRGFSRDTPCLRWVVVGVGVILSCYQGELTSPTEKSTTNLSHHLVNLEILHFSDLYRHF